MTPADVLSISCAMIGTTTFTPRAIAKGMSTTIMATAMTVVMIVAEMVTTVVMDMATGKVTVTATDAATTN
jgi:hypothetical protein